LAPHRLLLALSAICFVCACFSPALSFRIFSSNPAEYHLETQRGGNYLLIGWLGLLVGQFAWFANPCWLGGSLLLLWGRPVIARVLMGVALIFALTTFTLRGKQLPHDEGNVTQMVLQSLLPGFYLWTAAIVLALLSALLWPSPASSSH